MSDEKHAVLEIERARVEALLRHDVAALDRMMAEECVHTESNGTLRTKAQFLAAFAAQEFAFASFILEANEVRLYGDTAVVVGNYRNVIRTGSQIRPEKTARHLSMYVKRDGRWLLVAHQATESQKERPVAQRVE